MKIEQFDNNTLKVIRTKLDIKLQELSEELGITIESKNFSYSANEVSMKLEANINGAMTKEMSAVELYSEMEFGIKLECGHTFDCGNLGEVKLVAYKTRSRKYPWVVEKTNGSRYKLSTTQLRGHINPIKAVA
jgi:hypothetical protein